MLDELKDFNGDITVNGVIYNKNNLPNLEDFDKLDIYLKATEKIPELNNYEDKLFIFTVKEDMTDMGNGQRNFHTKWNNGVAMPFRRMNGTILKELDSMYKVSLHKAGVSWEGYLLKDFIDSIEEINE